MKYIFILLTATCLLTALSGYAQNSALQDKSGTTTVAASGNNIAVNVTDASISASFDTIRASAGKTRFKGFNIKFKATEGVSALTKGTKVKPTVDLGGYYGWGRGLNRVFITATLTNAYFKLLKTNNTNQFDSRSFFGGNLSANDNLITSTGLFSNKGKASPLVLGVSVGFGRINNLKDLTETDTYRTLSVTKNDTTTTSLQDKASGFAGSYKASYAANANLDVYIYPAVLNSRLAVGGYWRAQLSGHEPRNNIGVGALLAAKGAPLNINLGIMYQFNDVFNQLGKENEFLKRGGINIVAGYKF